MRLSNKHAFIAHTLATAEKNLRTELLRIIVDQSGPKKVLLKSEFKKRTVITWKYYH